MKARSSSLFGDHSNKNLPNLEYSDLDPCNIKDFKGGKEARLKEEGEEVGEGGERGGLTDVSCWASREGRTGTRPYEKSDQNRTRI